MTLQPINEILSTGESQTLEFKKSLSLKDKGLEAICAMLNTNLGRGIVVFGVEPGGTICGIEPGNLDTAQRSLAQSIRNKFEPPVVSQIHIQSVNNSTVLVLEVTRDQTIPYHEYDGRAWIREGTSNRLLTLAEKETLVRMRNRDKHPGPWKCNQCGTRVGVLSIVTITAQGMEKSYKCHCGGEFWPMV
jgi:ATP-dependent DNA helicase RecG